MYDLVVIGAGIVGAASALRIQQALPNRRIVVLEKAPKPALHQTGRNSGVVHAGVYYAPDSLKARYCREGLERTLGFCRQHQLAYDQCGKLIVATHRQELSRAEALFARCEQNHLSPQWLNQRELCQIEPNITGKAAIKVKQTAITDYPAITRKLLELFENAGGEVQCGQRVDGIEVDGEINRVVANGQTIQCRQLLNCAGLYADKMAQLTACDSDMRIIPFKGEYFQLPAECNQIVKHLIYPVPDPSLPFLGVHLTRMIDGSVTVGPNAVLAFAREGYAKFQIDAADVFDMVTQKRFWALLRRYPLQSLNEFKHSAFKSSYLSLVQRYCPQIERHHLLPYRSGIRAQAVDKQGRLLHDFVFAQSATALHLLNAPSPAATSAMPIADEVLRKLRHRLNG